MAHTSKPVTEYLGSDGTRPTYQTCRRISLVPKQLELFGKPLREFTKSGNSDKSSLSVSVSLVASQGNSAVIRIRVRKGARFVRDILVYLRSQESGESLPLHRADRRIAFRIVHVQNFTAKGTYRRYYDIPELDYARIVSEFWATRYGQKVRMAEEQRMEMLRSAWFPPKPASSPKDEKRRAATA